MDVFCKERCSWGGYPWLGGNWHIRDFVNPDQILACGKDSGVCARIAPTYVGICGEGERASFTTRLGQHLGSATQACQGDTVKPVGRHFRLPGHQANRDLVMLPIEVVSAKDPFLLRARETFNIEKFKTEKRCGVSDPVLKVWAHRRGAPRHTPPSQAHFKYPWKDL